MRSYLSKQMVVVIMLALCFVKGEAGNNEANNRSVVSKAFRFSSFYSPDVDKVDKSLVSRHYLGEDVAVLYYVFKSTYVQKKKNYTGASNVTVIQKPVIYDSVLKIDGLLKKAVKNGEYTKEQAAKIMEDCLSKSYSVFYADTDELENYLSKMESLDQYLALYNNISFE